MPPTRFDVRRSFSSSSHLHLKKLVASIAISSMLVVSVPAAPRSVVDSALAGWQEARFVFLSSGIADKLPNVLATLISRVKGGTRRPQPIDHLRIYPGPLNLKQGQEVDLAATAYDRNGEPISGVASEWMVTDVGRKKSARPLLNATFQAHTPGSFEITARARGKEATVPVTVSAFRNPIPADAEVRHVSNQPHRSIRAGATGRVDDANRSEGVSMTSQLLPGDGWNDGNWESSGEPGNQTGNPPGSPEDGGAGSGNFQISAPVLSLPGRSIDVGLSLYYNSRVWNKAGSELKYDIDRGAPAPGWSLGFGKIVFMGSLGGCMLIDADGTRHGYAGDITTWTGGSGGMSFLGHTADGSLTDYHCFFNYGHSGYGWARLANGTYINYSTIGDTPDQVHPTKITDAQGNYITITYRNPENPQLETITDTLGRVTTFQYDSLDRLISITVPRSTVEDPAYGTALTRIAVRIHYKAWTLNYDFVPGITPVVRNGVPWVIDAIYYPGTKTGYWFDDSDSYSTYGMITKVMEMRDMNWTAGSEAQGTVSRGTMTRQAEYNYPLSPANDPGRTAGIDLSDAPTYTSMKESWAGADVAGTTDTTYAVNENDSYWENGTSSPARSITISSVTIPDPETKIVNKQYTYRTPGAWTDGLPFVDETTKVIGTSSVLIGRSRVSWLQGTSQLSYQAPRPAWTLVTDENGDTVKTEYEYGTGYFNQVTRSCVYLNGSPTPARCRSATYENSSGYIGTFNTSNKWVSGRHIFSLILSTSVENPDGTKASLTQYEYDNYTAQPFTSAPGVIQHLNSHNAFNTDTRDGPPCLVWGPYYECRMLVPPPGCRDCEVWSQLPVYETATNKRGNVTKITTYVDPQNQTGPISETRAYDVTGNLVKIASSCCEETSIVYDDPQTEEPDMAYGYPFYQTRGASDPFSPHRMTTFTTYSYNSGLPKSATDANGRTTTTWYNPDTLRPVRTTLPTGAYTTQDYDEPAMTITEEVREVGGALAGKTKKYLNGLGRVIKNENYAPSGVIDTTETKYTKFGEAWKVGRPYRAGDPVYWSERFYDDQRRLTRVEEPDGSKTEIFYNESTLPSSVSAQPGKRIRVIDPWGRQRWGRIDQLGRLIQIVEPDLNRDTNPTGQIINDSGGATAGSLLTSYTYDTLGRLTQVVQGDQLRKFAYDGLGRLTRQKLAEQSMTLNDAGQYVGVGQSGAAWAEALTYDNRSNLTLKTDARGVRTNFSYQLPGGGDDPLNRLQMRWSDTSGPLDTSSPVHYAPAVIYSYATSGDKTRSSQIRTEGILTETFSYDGEGRVSTYNQEVDYRTTYDMTVDYLYDSLDRLKEVTYPAQWNNGGGRKIVQHNYDTASRLSNVKYGTPISLTDQVSDVGYNASGQITSSKIGAAGANQVTEEYSFDPQTGLLSNQKVTFGLGGINTLLDLSYDYSRGGSVGSRNGNTGNVAKVIDNLDKNKNKEYEYDAVGRLLKAKGGTTGALWYQKYSYDRYGNRTNVEKSGNGIDGNPIPMDGLPGLTYDSTSNRITSSGFLYDAAGNQLSGFTEDGTAVRYEYDSLNRLQVVKRTSDGALLQAFQFGSSNARLMDFNYVILQLKLFASVDGKTLAEYTELQHTIPTWTKGFLYFDNSQLATLTPGGQIGDENTEYNHPDRLGTRTITNPQTGGNSEQAHLPFGTALNSESTVTNNPRRFTSYDRSSLSGLDYAINRSYDSKQGRFTQVDPIGMQAVSKASPQTLNMYTYCGNDPVNHVDPDGLFFGRFFRWLANLIMRLFRSGVVRRIAVRFVVSFVLSGGNIGVAIQSVLPDILSQLGLTPNPLLTPSWNPNLPHPFRAGLSSLSDYIIKNFGPGPKTRALCRWILPFIKAIRPLADALWANTDYKGGNPWEYSGRISYVQGTGPGTGWQLNDVQRGKANILQVGTQSRNATAAPRNPKTKSADGFWDYFDIHAHVFEEGENVLIQGDHDLAGFSAEVLNSNRPSLGDRGRLDPKLIGLIVTSANIIVYTAGGRKCRFDR